MSDCGQGARDVLWSLRRRRTTVFDEQIQPGTFEFALHHLVDDELDLSPLDAEISQRRHRRQRLRPARDAQDRAAGLQPRPDHQPQDRGGLRTQRAVHGPSGDARPSYTHIAKFVRELGAAGQALFTQVLLTCDRLGLIGRSDVRHRRRQAAGQRQQGAQRHARRTGPPRRAAGPGRGQDRRAAPGAGRTRRTTGYPAPGPQSTSCAARRRPHGTSSPRAPSGSTAKARSSRPTSPTPTAPRWPPAKA